MKWWMFITMPLSAPFWVAAYACAIVAIWCIRAGCLLCGRKYTGKEVVSFSISGGDE